MGIQVRHRRGTLSHNRSLKSVIRRPSEPPADVPPSSSLHRHFRRKLASVKSSHSTDHADSSPRSLPQLPYKIHYMILSYLPFQSLLAAMKVNRTYERTCHELILKRFLALPDLHFTCAKRVLDDTAGVYGLEGMVKPDAHQYILTEDCPCDFRLMSTFFITTWPMPDSLMMEEIAASHRLKTFAITVGHRSRWVITFNLDDLQRRRKANPHKAISVPSLFEVYYHERRNQPIKGEWNKKSERSKLVYVPQTDDWFLTWQLSALVAWDVMDDEEIP